MPSEPSLVAKLTYNTAEDGLVVLSVPPAEGQDVSDRNVSDRNVSGSFPVYVLIEQESLERFRFGTIDHVGTKLMLNIQLDLAQTLLWIECGSETQGCEDQVFKNGVPFDLRIANLKWQKDPRRNQSGKAPTKTSFKNLLKTCVCPAEVATDIARFLTCEASWRLRDSGLRPATKVAKPVAEQSSVQRPPAGDPSRCQPKGTNIMLRQVTALKSNVEDDLEPWCCADTRCARVFLVQSARSETRRLLGWWIQQR